MKAFTQTQVQKDAFLEDLSKSVDWRFVMEKLREKYRVIVQDDVRYVNGDFVVHGNEIACRLDVDVKMRFSMICDKSGKCMKLSTARPDGQEELEFSEKEEKLRDETNNPRRREMARMATGLAEMIADINQSTF